VEDPSTSRSEEVTNTCTLANEWAEEELMAEQAICEAQDKYQPLESDAESEKY